MALTSPLTALLTTLLSHWPLLLLFYILLHALRNKYLSPLRHHPGPLLASTTRLYNLLTVASGRAHTHQIALHRRYGRVVRTAPNELSLASPEAARQLLSAGRRFHKTSFYGVFPPPENPDIFTETREDVHAAKKRIANVPYGMAAMRELAPFIDDTVDLLVQKMDDHILSSSSSSQKPFDLGEYLHFFAFDVLGQVAFSRAFGFLAHGTDVEHAIRTIDRSQTYNGIVGQMPELDLFLRHNPLWRLVPGNSTRKPLITQMALEEMDKRRPFEKGGVMGPTGGVGSDGRRDLMASLIQSHLADPSKFSEGDVFAVAHGAIFAGSDSTASTMQSFLWHVFVCDGGRVHAALTAELDAAVAAGTLPASGNVDWTHAQKLPYFQACLKEAMRIRPAVGLNMTRVVPPGGSDLDGVFVPGGTSVAVNGWVVHRDREVFGADADVFRPERWLEEEGKDKEGESERVRRMERCMIQFGGGSHLCIGRNLALLEINKVLPRLLRDYHFRLVHPGRPLREHSSFFVVQEGLDVYMERRRGGVEGHV